MEKDTVVADEKQAEEVETSETTGEETAKEETTNSEAPVEEAEENPYKKELERLNAEKEKAETIARQKDGALKEERRKRKEAEAKASGDAGENPKYLTPEEVDKALEEKLAKRDFNQMLSQVSLNPDEQALIKHHYENSIVRTGNVAEDIKKATAIANLNLIEEAKRQQMEREQSEAMSARFTGGQTYSRPGQPAYKSDPNLAAAAELLKKIGKGDAVKFLGK